MANNNLTNAKKAKNDEFYTQYNDIEKEINAYLEYDSDVFRHKTVLLPCDDPEWSNFTKFFAQNFEKLGLKKLISTSYASNSKTFKTDYQPSLFETDSPQYDKSKTEKFGKIFTLTSDRTGNGKVDIKDFDWEYLHSDGDFRTDEIKKLRDEADIIITNPPFSLFREFLSWIVEANKKFLIIGNMNAITYKEVFLIIKENNLWLGSNKTGKGNSMTFKDINKNDVDVASKWFTNIDHGGRHQILKLMTVEENLKYSKHKDIKGKSYYDKYDNYDALEIPFTDSIPSDFEGVMGVPISFLTKYNPEQFEIIGLGISNSGKDAGVRPYTDEHKKYRKEVQKRGAVDGDLYMIKDGVVDVPYARILIRHKKK